MATDLTKAKQILEEEEEEGEEQIEDWDDWKTDEEDPDPDFLCLFCNLRRNSIELLFDHCSSDHSFDFRSIRKSLRLDFYDSFKLINYIRSQVENEMPLLFVLYLHLSIPVLGFLISLVFMEKSLKFINFMIESAHITRSTLYKSWFKFRFSWSSIYCWIHHT